MKTALAWAVVRGGECDTRTVSPTRRGAIVNWLYAHCRLSVMQSHTDFQIETWWQTNSKQHSAGVIEVEVRQRYPV